MKARYGVNGLGAWVDRRGYVRVYLSKGKWIYEHRLVMEMKLKRKLGSKEAVHHINGIRADNRPRNLELMPVGEHIAHHNRSQPKRGRRAIPEVPATAAATVSSRLEETYSKWLALKGLTIAGGGLEPPTPAL